MSMKMKNTNDAVVRIADYQNRQDAQAIIGLLDHYARDPMGGGKPLSEFVLKNLITELQKYHGAFSVVAWFEGVPIGLVNCFQTFSTFKCRPLVNIHDVIIREDYRGYGVAEILLKQVQRTAKERGCCKLTLEVLEGNASAKKVYQKFGFNAYELDPEMGNALFWEKII